MSNIRVLELSDDALEGVAGGITAEAIHIGSGQSASLTLDSFARRSAVDVPPEVLDAFNAARTSGGGGHCIPCLTGKRGKRDDWAAENRDLSPFARTDVSGHSGTD